MNSKERLAGYIAGKPVDRRPNLTIVGSVVTQYTGIDIETYCKDGKKMAESATKAAYDLKLDFIQIASDLAREAEAFGSKLAYYKDKLPDVKVPALEDISDAASLKPLKTADTKRLYDLVEALSHAKTLSDDIYPMTLVNGPATVAGNTRGVQDFLMDSLDDPEACQGLLDVVCETSLDLIRNLADAGAEYLYVADPVASLFSASQYEELILPYHKIIFAEMKKLGITPRLHMCGNTQKILACSKTSGAAIIDIDHAVDFAKALETVGDSVILNGNIDPVADVFSCDAQHTKEAIIKTADSIGRKRAMFMPGCELPQTTPICNVKAIYEALAEIGG